MRGSRDSFIPLIRFHLVRTDPSRLSHFRRLFARFDAREEKSPSGEPGCPLAIIRQRPTAHPVDGAGGRRHCAQRRINNAAAVRMPREILYGDYERGVARKSRPPLQYFITRH